MLRLGIKSLSALTIIAAFVFLFTRQIHAGSEPSLSLSRALAQIEEADVWQVRENAILSLMNFHDREIFEEKVFDRLLQLLEDPNPGIRYAAINLMFPMSWEITPFFFETPKAAWNSYMPLALLPKIRIAAFSALGKENDPWVRGRLINLLANIESVRVKQGLDSNQRIRDLLVSELKHPDPYARLVAIRHLTISEPRYRTNIQDIFRSMLHDDVPLIRSTLYRLVDFGNFEDNLVGMQDRDFGERVRAVNFLIKKYPNHPRTYDMLLERLYDPNSLVVITTISALVSLNKPGVVPALLDLLPLKRVEEIYIRDAVEKITGTSLETALKGHTPYQEPIIPKTAPVRQVQAAEQLALLKSKDPHKRISAVLRLTWSEAPGVVEALLRMLEDKVPRVRYAALDALGRAYRPYARVEDGVTAQVLDALIKMTQDLDQHVRKKAILAVGDFIRTFAGWKEGWNRKEIQAFYQRRNRKAVQVFYQVMENNPSAFIRKAVAEVFSTQYSFLKSSKIFLPLLSDHYPRTRKLAFGGFIPGVRCQIEPFEMIFPLLEDPMPTIRIFAVNGLAELSRYVEPKESKKIRMALKKVLEDEVWEDIKKAAKKAIEAFERYEGQKIERAHWCD